MPLSDDELKKLAEKMQQATGVSNDTRDAWAEKQRGIVTHRSADTIQPKLKQ